MTREHVEEAVDAMLDMKHRIQNGTFYGSYAADEEQINSILGLPKSCSYCHDTGYFMAGHNSNDCIECSCGIAARARDNNPP